MKVNFGKQYVIFRRKEEVVKEKFNLGKIIGVNLLDD